jgi:carbamate kinase
VTHHHINILVALGGNAILKHTDQGTAEEQNENIGETAKKLVEIIHAGFRLIVTHGNGPQVGDILLKNDIAKNSLPPMPLDICSAESQGMIGYMMQQKLQSAIRKAGLKIPVVTVLTQTLVDAKDSAFKSPSKPIGPFYTAMEASELKKSKGWTIINDSGRGFRRVVPSPEPVRIIEGDLIKTLFDEGAIVIASGGGGVPVIEEKGSIHGVEGVIDKDKAAVLLAEAVSADVLLILTDVDNVYLEYGRRNQRTLHKVSLDTMKEFLADGQFAPGSMKPKVEAAIKFLEDGGNSVIITSIDNALKALQEEAGTIITIDGDV